MGNAGAGEACRAPWDAMNGLRRVVARQPWSASLLGDRVRGCVESRRAWGYRREPM